MARGGKRSSAGRKRTYPDGTRWEMIPLPETFAKLLIELEGKSLREIIVEAVRRQYSRLPWSNKDANENDPTDAE